MCANHKYKWTLRKGGRKETCPACGKRRFVPFVLAADGVTPAGAEFGRCDREQSCGYFRYPGGDRYESGPLMYATAPVLPPAEFPAMMMEEHGVTAKNTLYMAYARLIGAGRLKAAMEAYRCGTGASGECIYLQYDGEVVRTAKAIMYGVGGHRLKDGDGSTLPVRWLHRAPHYAYYMQGHRLKQCLFGQHLLAECPDAEVCLVEGEKTAVLMAAVEGLPMAGRLWLACGGSQMLKGAIDLSCLEGRRVTLFPDEGQWWNWLRTAEAHGWECVRPGEGYGKGEDIWDVTERRLRNEVR